MSTANAPRHRRLRRTVTAAGRASSDRLGFAPLARGEILAASDALMDLGRRLEGPGPVEAMGVALARLLVVDVNSPLAAGAEPGTAHTVVRLATVALDMSPHHAAGDQVSGLRCASRDGALWWR